MGYQTKHRNKNRGYINLTVWQRAMDLFELTWRIIHVDAQIGFKLRSQLADAAQSVSANIAEGYGRRGVTEYLQLLYVGLGSLGETLTRSMGLHRTDQISNERSDEFDKLHYEVENRLLRLIEKLEQKRDDGTWVARIAEDPEEYRSDSSLHHSITPSLQRQPCVNSSLSSRAKCAVIFIRRSLTLSLSFFSW